MGRKGTGKRYAAGVGNTAPVTCVKHEKSGFTITFGSVKVLWILYTLCGDCKPGVGKGSTVWIPFSSYGAGQGAAQFLESMSGVNVAGSRARYREMR